MDIADVVQLALQWNKIVLICSSVKVFITNETTMILVFSSECGLVGKALNWYCRNLLSSTLHRADPVPTPCFILLISKHFETNEAKY